MWRAEEVAGNKTAILLTVVAPAGTAVPAHTRIVFIQSLATDPGRWRMALATPVSSLCTVLRGLPPTVQLEHVFDY